MFKDIAELFSLIVTVLLRGGWVGFVIGLVYMLYRLYIDYINITWYNKLEWQFLKVTVPKDNEKSPLAFEEVLNQLHSVHETITWAEKYIEGQFQIWFTWEVTSIGGMIGNYARILPKHRDVFEAAIYAQYPNAEIAETEDYFSKIPRYKPEESEYDVFAFSFRYIRETYYPTRTYYDFEHASADTFVDPVAGMWEELSKLSPYEMFVIQFVLRPIGDDEWKEKGRQLVKKLKGEPEAIKASGDSFGKLMGAVFGPILDAFIRPAPSEGRVQTEKYEPPSLMLHLTEDEKAVIDAVEKKLSKWAYQTKIHCLYLSPREKYNPTVIVRAVVGSFKSFGANNLNALKPLLKRWTKVNYFLFKNLEKPIIRIRLNYRKWKYMSLIRRRFYFWGPPANIMSVEEIASYLHFPQIEVSVPPIDKVTVAKVQPPPELPVAPGV